MIAHSMKKSIFLVTFLIIISGMLGYLFSELRHARQDLAKPQIHSCNESTYQNLTKYYLENDFDSGVFYTYEVINDYESRFRVFVQKRNGEECDAIKVFEKDANDLNFRQILWSPDRSRFVLLISGADSYGYFLVDASDSGSKQLEIPNSWAGMKFITWDSEVLAWINNSTILVKETGVLDWDTLKQEYKYWIAPIEDLHSKIYLKI